MKGKASVSQFTGTYLNRLWARRFVLGSLLQNYDPKKADLLSIKNNNTAQTKLSRMSSMDEDEVDRALLRAQRVLSEAWALPVKMMDRVSERRIYRLLSNYAACEGLLSDEALTELKQAMSLLPGAPTNLGDPREMETLLYILGYAEEGDNLHRVSYSGQLHYSPEAHQLMAPYLSEKWKRDGSDPYDVIREYNDGPAYAIDSATTSEVDDAIGVEISPTGEEWFTVYVSDATVYCPYDSGLEQITARSLATTTYLPEDVFFMLPKPIVEAATLREDQPCRTFNIRFQLDSSGAIKNYSVHVGWLRQLRRLTYEQMEYLVESVDTARNRGEASPSSASHSQSDVEGKPLGGNATVEESTAKNTATVSTTPPSWLKEADRNALLRIYRAATSRFTARMERSREEKGSPPIEGGLPDPYIKVSGTQVLSVRDQILSTKEARVAVAEMMIAANEVCSLVAQANGIAIPFRGTRSLSSNHEAAQYFEEPQGVAKMESLDNTQKFMAEAMQETIRRLSSVTRALYHHTPLFHAGLLTRNYTHSTSPLRRYPDMLVHHQLKVWLYHQEKYKITSSNPSAAPFLQQFIPEYTMATHCATISMKQERSALLQDKSTRYWILRYMEQLLRHGREDSKNNSEKLFICYVGETKRVVASPEYERFYCHFEDAVDAISRPSPEKLSRSMSSLQEKAKFTYVSHIYLPEVQLTHTIHHSSSAVRVGTVIECKVTRLWPTQGVLEMALVSVKSEGNEHYFNQILQGGIISHIDA